MKWPPEIRLKIPSKAQTELEQLCSKRDEMKAELEELRPMQAAHPSYIGRVISLSTMLCDCDQMIANIRAKQQIDRVNKTRTTHA
jgi:hypothetical protein